MAYSSQLPADSDPRPRGTISPDDALPPVEPPSASFILQLFVVPGVIVTIIVLVWLLFNWLAQMGNDPDEYVNAIKRNNEGRWQAAVNLANALNNERGPGFKELRQNKQVVKELSQVLNEEIDDGSMQEKPVMFRMFLCRAIGSFEVPDGLPVLLKAVETNRGKEEETVRRSALEAIALLADNVLKAEPKQRLADPKLESTLLAATGDADPLIRSSAVFAMGVIGGEPLLAKLRFMTKDSYPDVRYNAATALARQGDPAARDVLLEMIDPDEEAGVKIEEEKGHDFKRALIEFNALRAIGTLLQVNPQISGEEFVPSLEKLLKRRLPNNVKLEAENVLRTIQKPRSAEKPAASAA